MSIIQVTENRGIPKYKQIIESVEKELTKGRLRKGDRLPSVNAIRNKFSLSRDTVFMAYGELKKRGIIEAIAGKGYYVKSEDVNVKKKVFLLFDELNIFKEDLYNSFFNELGSHFQIDIFFHHFNTHVFEKHITDNLDNYNYYVIMPASLKKAKKSLSRLPKDKVFLLDQTNESLKDYAGVFQNFERNVYEGLNAVITELSRYKRLVFVKPKSNQPKGILLGYKKFIKQGSIKSLEINGVEALIPSISDVYFILDDRSLIEVIKKIKTSHLKIGKDVGLIAYNDSLLKEIVEGGITAISTNFHEMGKRMAKMVINEEFAHIENPNNIIVRQSL